MANEFDKIRPMDEVADFVMNFIDESSEHRDPMEDIWDEAEDNFLVNPFSPNVASRRNQTKYPLDEWILSHRALHSRNSEAVRARLADPETHQQIMTLVAGMVTSLFPSEGGFVKTRPPGMEDALESTEAELLLEYCHALPGQFWAFYEWLLGTATYGTYILEAFWDYKEEPRSFRTLSVNPQTGRTSDTSFVANAPVWDDVRYKARAIRDFYPDQGATTIQDSEAAALEDETTAGEMLRLAEAGIYNKERVNRAIDFSVRQQHIDSRDDHGIDDPSTLEHQKARHPDYMPMSRFRFIGNTPFKGPDGWSRREIVVIAGEVVRDKVWPRRLPWFEGRIIPRLGSFYGIGTSEINRHDQDFLNTLKSMLSDAVVRSVHMTPMVHENANVNMARFSQHHPGKPVRTAMMDGVRYLPYDPPLGDASAIYGGTKQQMRESFGVTNMNQGLPSETQFRSATAFAGTRQNAAVRPELFTRVMEQEWVPPVGRFSLELYQEFTEPGGLSKRIGDSNTIVPLAAIMADTNVRYVGTRIGGTPQDKIAIFREIVAAAAQNPIILQSTPWIPLLRKWWRDLGAEEIAAMVGNPQLVQLNTLLGTLAPNNPGGGNNNGTDVARPPIDAPAAQLLGGPQ